MAATETPNFTVTLSRALTTTATVHYATMDGTAIAGTDYTAMSGTLTFNPGDLTKTISIPVLANPNANVDKSFSVVLSDPSGAILNSDASGEFVISTATAGTLPVINVTAGTIITVASSLALVPLKAINGNQFGDANGNLYRLKSFNYYGFDGTDLIIHGLYAGRRYADILNQFAAFGFNCIRLNCCDDMVTSTVTFSGTSGNQYIDIVKNPELVGLTPLQALDVIVYYASTIGMRIVIDQHRISMTSIGAGDSGFGTDGWPNETLSTSTFLYGGSNTPRIYNETNWQAFWSSLATHFTTDHVVPNNPNAGKYASNAGLAATIVGIDPHNEPYNVTWEVWAGMVERLVAVINPIAPNWMYFPNGVWKSDDGTDEYWYGGYLKGVATRPINLGSNQALLAYQPHEYAHSVSDQLWLSSVADAGGAVAIPGDAGGFSYYPAITAKTVPNYPNNLQAVWDAYWGFIFKQRIAPLFIGEFGGGFGFDALTGAADPLQKNASFELQWIGALDTYLNGTNIDGTSTLTGTDQPMSFSYFALNPESNNPLGGLLEGSDYLTPIAGKLNAIQPLIGAAVPIISSGTTTTGTTTTSTGGTTTIPRYMPVWYESFYSFGDIPSQFVAGATGAAQVANTRLSKIPPYVNEVIICFCKPACTYVSGTISTLAFANFQAQTGLAWNDAAATMKASTDLLRVRNPAVKIVLAVGGAGADWSTTNYSNLVSLVTDMGWDGVVIDYEPPGYDFGCVITGSTVACTADATLQTIVTSFRSLLAKPKRVEIVGWSNGCYGIGAWSAADPLGQNAGCFINLSTSSAAAMLDAIHVATYDASAAYDPIIALDSYLNYWTTTPIYVTSRSRGADNANDRDWSVSYLQTVCAAIATRSASAAGLGIYSMQWPPYPTDDTGATGITQWQSPQASTASRPNEQLMALTIATAFGLPDATVPLWDDTHVFVPY